MIRKITTCLCWLVFVLLLGCGKDSPQPEPSKSVDVKSIEVKDKDLIMKPGQKETLSYTVLPAESTNKEVEITSSNLDVITINGKELTAVKVGKAEITIKSKTSSVSVKIQAEVVPIDATEIKLDKSDVELLVGEKETLTASIIPDNATERELIWESSDPEIATVSSSGEVEAIAAGSAEISVSVKSAKISARATIVVRPIFAESIVLSPTAIVMHLQSSKSISASVLPENTTDKTLEWKSNAPSIVSVDINGKITALKVGSAVITATAKKGKVHSSVIVEVKEDIAHVTGRLNFTLTATSSIIIGMHIYMSNGSIKPVTIKRVEAFNNGVLAATALTEFSETVKGESVDEYVIGFTQTRNSSAIGNFPPNWYAKVFFIQNGQNYAMTITDEGYSTQRLQQSSIGINPEWDGENTTEIPSK